MVLLGDFEIAADRRQDFFLGLGFSFEILRFSGTFEVVAADRHPEILMVWGIFARSAYYVPLAH